MKNSMKKKILFFTHSSTGGAERVTVTIAKMLPKDRYEAKFVLVDKRKGNISDFIPEGYDVDYLLYSNIWCGVTFRLIQLLRKEKPYAVFATAMPLSARVSLAAHLVGGIKIILRNCNYFCTIRWDQLLLCRMTYRYADWIIAQQEEMKDDILCHVRSLRPERVIALHNPLDVDSIDKKCSVPSPYTDKNTLKYVWVARFAETKGQDVLAKAFVKVAKCNEKAHLYFVGKYDEHDPFFQSVKRVILDAGIEDRVHFVGFDTNPYRWVRYCDCFVLPSRIEGLPNSLIEAQYLGCPAVAAVCIPIISRIVKEGVTGYVVPPEDSDAMADAMLKAPKLGRVKMEYKSASNEDFIKLF